VWVRLRVPNLSRAVEFLCLLPLTIPAIVLVAGLAPEYKWVSFYLSDSILTLAFAYLVVAGSLVAFTAYVWLLQHAPVSKVATYAYVNPAIAIFLGWIILSERITATTLVGAVIIVASVAFIVRRGAVLPSQEDEPALNADRQSAAMSTAAPRGSTPAARGPRPPAPASRSPGPDRPRAEGPVPDEAGSAALRTGVPSPGGCLGEL